jgi:hypothetical protein
LADIRPKKIVGLDDPGHCFDEDKYENNWLRGMDFTTEERGFIINFLAEKKVDTRTLQMN